MPIENDLLNLARFGKAVLENGGFGVGGWDIRPVPLVDEESADRGMMRRFKALGTMLEESARTCG